MSRTKAKETLDMKAYKEAMAGIYTTSVNEKTIDEAPMAYKSLDDIIDVIRDSVDIIDIMKPVYNFKASDDDLPWKKKKVNRAGEREAFVKAIRKFMSMKTLTAPLLRELIDHIDVYEVEGQGKNKTQRVVIYYKFVGYLEIPNDLSRPTYSADLREGVSVEYITCEAGEDILDDEPEADKKAE